MITRNLFGVILVLSLLGPASAIAQELPPLPNYTPSDESTLPPEPATDSSSSSTSQSSSAATAQTTTSAQTTSSPVTSADTGTNTLILALVAGGLSILAVAIWSVWKNKRAN